MNPVERLRVWWQQRTGEEETPFDGDAPAWLVSMVVHLIGLLVFALITVKIPEPYLTLTITTPLSEEELLEELELPQEFLFTERPADEVGAADIAGPETALALAPNLSEISDLPTPELSDALREIDINRMIKIATGPNFNEMLAVKGTTGVAATGAAGAIDRITQEILLSLEERKTLVVWLFDQSPSMVPQRKEVSERFDRVYRELGIIEAAGNPAFAKHEDKPLLTSIIAFGKNVSLRTKTPTDNLAEIKKAIEEIEIDESGIERIFSAFYMAAEQYKTYAMPDPATGQPRRNVMLIAFTDERGDDHDGLEATIDICRRYRMPVYVVGVPALFGRDEALVKWIDPDPEYDQSVQWGRVNQGPETFLPERLHLSFEEWDEEFDALDSGFGPYALTRLCYETGGIFFTVHPNRNVLHPVSKNETDVYASYIRYFFDPQVMRRYRPDYVSRDEYLRILQANRARAALVKAADMSLQSGPLSKPRLRFERRANDRYVADITAAQQDAAKNVWPVVNAVVQELAQGVQDREKERVPRWQAGFDLAIGRALAMKTRADNYMARLEQAKNPATFADPRSNVYELVPASELIVSQDFAEKANFYLVRVIEQHPDTPWALIARKELDQLLGWQWRESYIDFEARERERAARGDGGGGGGRGIDREVRRDDRPPPPPRRDPPRL